MYSVYSRMPRSAPPFADMEAIIHRVPWRVARDIARDMVAQGYRTVVMPDGSTGEDAKWALLNVRSIVASQRPVPPPPGVEPRKVGDL